MNGAVPEPITADDTLVHDPRALRNILIGMITALVAVIAAMSGLNVAQQEMAVGLHASQNGVLWIINAYTLTLASCLLPVGAIGDRWGRKKVLLTGLVVFGVATVGALFAASAATMIIARVVAGSRVAMAARPDAPTVERVAELHRLARSLFDGGRLPALGGLGLYPGWIHVDVRAKVNGHLATWGGQGAGDAQ